MWLFMLTLIRFSTNTQFVAFPDCLKYFLLKWNVCISNRGTFISRNPENKWTFWGLFQNLAANLSFTAPGSGSHGAGPWFGVPRHWALVRGPTALGPGSGSHGAGPWFGVPRRWALVRGPTALGPGSGSHGAGPWFGVPRRWTHPYFCLLKLRQKSSTVCSRTRGLILLSQSCTWLVHTSKSTAAEVSRNNALKTKDLSTEWKVSFMFRIEQLRFTNNKH